jgi:hypothetical protein
VMQGYIIVLNYIRELTIEKLSELLYKRVYIL